MADTETIDERLRAVERALTGTDQDLAGLSEAAALATRVDDLEARLDDIETQLADLEASTQAVRGYVGNVRSVNRDVEQRADVALAKAERLEARLDDEPVRGREPERGRTGTSDDGPASDQHGDERPVENAGERGETPRWTAGATDPEQRDSGGRQRPRTRSRASDHVDEDESETDDGGFLAGLTGSL